MELKLTASDYLLIIVTVSQVLLHVDKWVHRRQAKETDLHQKLVDYRRRMESELKDVKRRLWKIERKVGL